jgi:hypothetical protein
VRVLDELGHGAASRARRPPSRIWVGGARHECIWCATGPAAGRRQPGRRRRCSKPASPASSATPCTPTQWQLRCEGRRRRTAGAGRLRPGGAGLPHPQAHDLLLRPAWRQRCGAPCRREVAPCWTLMVAFPQGHAARPGPPGPAVERGAQHAPPHRWLARESQQARPRPASSAGPCRPARPGRPSTWRTTPSASGQAAQGLCRDHRHPRHARHAVVHRWRFAQTQQPLGQPTCWDAGSGSACAATGAWATGSKTPLSPGLELALAWRDPRPAGERLPRPLCALAHRPAACGLAGGGAGQLARRAGPGRALAGAHRRRGHAALRARRRPTRSCSSWPPAAWSATSRCWPVAARRAYQAALDG